MGTARAGFGHDAVIERNKECCLTVAENQNRGLEPVRDWRLIESDVRQVDYSAFQAEPDLVAGGPPCQPFSMGGKHRAWNDERDGFPEMVRAVRELRPRAFVVENVKGLLRQTFATYFEYIELQLCYPELTGRKDEDWQEHLARLEAHRTGRGDRGLHYNVVYRLLNAADYGVPQRRERVFIVGFRSDVAADWSFPEPTHSREALLYDQWVTGEYWDRHEVPQAARPPRPATAPPPRQATLLDFDAVPRTAWRTVRDAIRDLPDPEADPEAAARVANHWANPGARSYPGHTGSPWDEPAKTLKAGDHGVPGGENTLAFGDGRVRYFTVREAARLQTFPDSYIFPRAWTESMRQLGNAVPVELAHAVAASVHARLDTL
jgi:DNA (cytosine-5)-methyltransferase 1